MKKIKPNLLLIPFAILYSTPVTTSLASCSRDVDYTQEVLDEFLGNKRLGIKGLVSCPRPGGYYDAIIPYLTQRVKKIAHLKDDQIYVDKFHNMYFDIPATKGYEKADMVILQGHTDMIVAGMEEDDAKTTPIDAVIDNGTVHSRDFKTSIGSDDGSGVSIALTILKNRNKFSHGPIRFLLTADEDSGMVGAKFLAQSWLKYNNEFIKWLINIDAEEEGYVYRSCAGFVPFKLWAQYNNETNAPLENEYVLKFDGLTGGHSGIDIINKLANADRLTFELLYYLQKEKNAQIQIVEHNHKRDVGGGEEEDINYEPNQLIANSKLVFKSNLDRQTIVDCLDILKDQWKSEEYYAGDDWDNIKTKSVIEKVDSSVNPYLSTEISSLLIEQLGNYEDSRTADKWTSLHYGVLEYDEEHLPKSSVNLGPVSIKYNNGEQKFDFSCQISARSSVADYANNEEEPQKYSIAWLRNQYMEVQEANQHLDEQSPCYPWTRDNNNKLVKILVDGYKALGVEPTIFDSLSGVEPAMWTHKSKGATVCSCVGPRTDHAHSVTETLYIDTIEPCLKNILSALEQIANGI